MRASDGEWREVFMNVCYIRDIQSGGGGCENGEGKGELVELAVVVVVFCLERRCPPANWTHAKGSSPAT